MVSSLYSQVPLLCVSSHRGTTSLTVQIPTSILTKRIHFGIENEPVSEKKYIAGKEQGESVSFKAFFSFFLGAGEEDFP